MTKILLLRVASVIAFLFALGHTIGAPWTPAETEGAIAVVQSMKSVQFDVMGSNRSYRDFYYGFGMTISVLMFAQALVIWLLGGLGSVHATGAGASVA